jgi:hypothetical protein
VRHERKPHDQPQWNGHQVAILGSDTSKHLVPSFLNETRDGRSADGVLRGAGSRGSEWLVPVPGPIENIKEQVCDLPHFLGRSLEPADGSLETLSGAP